MTEFQQQFVAAEPLPPREQEVRFYVLADGTFFQMCDYVNGDWIVPDGAVVVDSPPPTGEELWDGKRWVARAITTQQVNAERDRRASTGFVFQGNPYDFDDKSMLRITGAAALADRAQRLHGVALNNPFWHGEPLPFMWRDKNNQSQVMDIQTVFAFSAAAADWESRHVFYAAYLKGLPVIPLDYTDDKYWP